MSRIRQSLPLLIAGLLFAHGAWAFQAGMRQITIPGANTQVQAQAQATTVALYYPTQAAARAIPMGPFAPIVAINGAPEPTVKGLIVLSHGVGGSELGHSRLAEGLAQHGYLVAALRHPRDNWQDSSLFNEGAAAYFDERPRQVSRVIDAVLRDPQWKDRIAADARGPKVGAVGHSAGGYTVLALAGGQPDVAAIARHCELDRAADPIFCQTGRASEAASRPLASTLPAAQLATKLAAPLADPRVRAVVALAPVGAVFTAASLSQIQVPVALYLAKKDRWLVPRFHGEWIAQNLPTAQVSAQTSTQVHRVPNAWHFAFMDAPGMPIPSPDGDIGDDPPGFDRAGFLNQLSKDLPAFFDKALR